MSEKQTEVARREERGLAGREPLLDLLAARSA